MCPIMPDAASDIPPTSPLWSPTAVIEWLVMTGWRQRDTAALIMEIGERLLASGLPVWRIFCTVRSLHPQYFGQAYVWREGAAQVERRPGLWELLESDDYRNNPVSLVIEQGVSLRRRLTVPDAELEHPVLVELKEQGVTDYVILPMLFSNGERSAVSFASRSPEGFSRNHLRELNDLVQVLALVLESHSLRSTAANLLDTYVGRQAGSRILNGEIRRGTARTIYSAIWYSDLRGFTELSEAYPRERVIAALNAYFEAITTAVHGRSGEVLKYIGDGVMAIFPVVDGEEGAAAACRRALDAASAAEEAMAAVNEGRAAVGAPILDYGIALHIGEVTYGNIGAADRLDFTVIGPAVNFAHRLEPLCRTVGRRPLLSRDFMEFCGADRPAEYLGRFELKGLAQPQDVYTPARRT